MKAVTISIHPDDQRREAVTDLIRAKFPEVNELSFHSDPLEWRPRAIGIVPENLLPELLAIDATLFKSFTELLSLSKLDRPPANVSTLRRVIVVLHPDDVRGAAVLRFLTDRFLDVDTFEIHRHEAASYPRAVDMKNSSHPGELTEIDLALFREFGE